VILADAFIWVDHLRQRNEELSLLLSNDVILIHPFVIGKVTCGNPRYRLRVLAGLYEVPSITTVSDSAVMDFVEHNMLSGTGIGWVDAHLLTATAKTKGCAGYG